MTIIFIIIILCLIVAVVEEYQHNSEIDTEAQSKLYAIQEEITNLSSEKVSLLQEIADKKREAEETYDKERKRIAQELDEYKKNATDSVNLYCRNLERDYNKIEQEYNDKIALLEDQELEQKNILTDLNNQIDELQSALDAGARAQRREQEKEQQLDFYKLSVTAQDMDDIKTLEKVKLSLHNPVVLSKLIWTTYFQKQTVELCNRVLGTTDKVCGIYKITDLTTQQYYIGQSVDISRRFQEHIRYGLGIDAPSSNKLYQAMQKDGVWNFTFELLEQCPRDQLDEKEKFWIKMYSAYDYGLNSSHGNGVKK